MSRERREQSKVGHFVVETLVINGSDVMYYLSLAYDKHQDNS